MQRAMAHYVPREMAVLGLVELTVSFLVIQAMIAMSGTPSWLAGVAGTMPGASLAPAALIAVSIGAIGLPIGLYQPEVCFDCRRLLPAVALAAVLLLGIMLLFGGSFTRGHAIETARLCAAGLATMVLVRLVWRLDIIRRLLVRPVLVLGGEGEVAAFRLRLQGRRGRNFDAVTMAADQVSLPALRQRRIWGVVVTSTLDGTAADATLDCKMLGLPVLTSEEFHETYLGRVDLDALTADRFLAGDRHSRGRVSAGVKRLCDIVIGSLMLVLALPAMVSAAVAIKLDSPGPVFYRQERVGRFGKTFTIFKFRSMTVNAEACGKPRWAQKEDPRVTRVGRFIRASRIDELPQLANIIRGDMSLVGPRPERPHFVEQLARAIPFYHQRAYVKPGLTGWAQVNYPYGASVEDAREKLAYDLFYVKHRTVWLDLVTLLSTVRVVLFRDGAR